MIIQSLISPDLLASGSIVSWPSREVYAYVWDGFEKIFFSGKRDMTSGSTFALCLLLAWNVDMVLGCSSPLLIMRTSKDTRRDAGADVKSSSQCQQLLPPEVLFVRKTNH